MKRNCSRRETSLLYRVGKWDTKKRESFYSSPRHLRQSFRIHAEIRARQSRAEVRNFPFRIFVMLPGVHSWKRTISCLIVAAVLPRSIISALRKIRESACRGTARRPPQWQNNDFTPPLTKLYRWSLRSSYRRFLNFPLPDSRPPHSVSPYCFARRVLFRLFGYSRAKSVTFFLITFPTLELLNCIIIVR